MFGHGLSVLLSIPVFKGIRVHDEVERCPQRVKCLEIGDWLQALKIGPEWLWKLAFNGDNPFMESYFLNFIYK